MNDQRIIYSNTTARSGTVALIARGASRVQISALITRGEAEFD